MKSFNVKISYFVSTIVAMSPSCLLKLPISKLK